MSNKMLKILVILILCVPMHFLDITIKLIITNKYIIIQGVKVVPMTLLNHLIQNEMSNNII